MSADPQMRELAATERLLGNLRVLLVQGALRRGQHRMCIWECGIASMSFSAVAAWLEFARGHAALVSVPSLKGESPRQRAERIDR